MSNLPLKGKVAVVTGSSRGIGAAIVKHLASEGANVVINYSKSASLAESLVNEINSSPGEGKAVAIQANLSSIPESKRLIEDTVKEFGRLDIVVLNAAMMEPAPLETTDPEQFDRHFDLNVKSPLFITQSAAKYLKPGGRVIFISTGLTKNSSPAPISLLYIATKGTIEHIVRVLAKDLGTRGITVNAVAPGPVDTDLFREGKTEEMIKYFNDIHPQKRIAQPEEIAPLVSFLSKEEGGWVNGQTIYINGGYAV
ncbi:NAD-P-binding protein [Abortiporus biennis]|nr:NAD-P-binding protein [Abortiporus biennis]